MAIKVGCDCVKLELPNGCVVDILTPIFEEISKWLQLDEAMPESGGYIVGYEHKTTKNIVLERVSRPYPLDKKSRISFEIRDPMHKIFLLKSKKQKSFYMGVWHTHPQSHPVPSKVDWDDWNATLECDQTACDYIFFLIAGTDSIRVWVGDHSTRKITELNECKKIDGIYQKA